MKIEVKVALHARLDAYLLNKAQKESKADKQRKRKEEKLKALQAKHQEEEKERKLKIAEEQQKFNEVRAQ